MKLLLLLNLGATLYMVGLIWMVQVVHYPLMDRVSPENFAPFEQDHQRLTTFVVAPPMLIEAATAVALVFMVPKPECRWLLWVALGLLGVAWLTTYAISVPCHTRLAQGFDAATHARLVITNWIRTFAWSARGAIMLYITASVIKL
ncbi:MAG: hypothetical protein AAGF97_11400 [Planctomycetota bacterium]